MIINAAVKEELEIVRVSNGGRLTPASVLEYAKDKDTALWGCINEAGLWDDSTAAERGRLLFCAEVIRKVKVTILDNGNRSVVRAYVNLLSERRDKDNGGYRLISEVAATQEGQEEILETALAELKAFRTKYALLKHLAPILASIDWFLETREEQAAKPAANGKAGLAVPGKAGRGLDGKRRRVVASSSSAMRV